MTTIDSDLAPPEDDDTFQLLAMRRRRKLPLVTAVLVVALVAAGAFIGGVEIQKHQGGSSASSFRGALTSGLAGQGVGTTTGRTGTTGSTRGGGFGGVGGAGGTTFGTVTVIKGSTLYVTDANGNTVKVTTSASSRVTKTTTATITLGSVQPGDTVVVRGTQQKNGNLAADTITLGAGGFGGGASGFGSGGASGFGSGSSGSGG
jgi:hypothetical protein